LHFADFVWNSPELDDVVIEVRYGKRCARIGVARLADRTGIEKIAFVGLDAKRRE
jgi:hypothetical protein